MDVPTSITSGACVSEPRDLIVSNSRVECSSTGATNGADRYGTLVGSAAAQSSTSTGSGTKYSRDGGGHDGHKDGAADQVEELRNGEAGAHGRVGAPQPQDVLVA